MSEGTVFTPPLSAGDMTLVLEALLVASTAEGVKARDLPEGRWRKAYEERSDRYFDLHQQINTYMSSVASCSEDDAWDALGHMAETA